MTEPASILLTINSDELESFCSKILSRSRDITKTHDALITLESFISIFGKSNHGTNNYKIIESTIKDITEQSRQQLLQENTSKLVLALQNCDTKSLANIHTPLSRNGFYQILQTAISRLSDDEIRIIMIWTENWLKEAKQLAEEASGFPDAMDLNKAEISFEEFQAISDIDRVVNYED